MSDALSVAAVANELGLSVRRVRQLINAGALSAERVGGSWVVSRDAAERFARRGRRRGRPLSAENSWALLQLLSGDQPESAQAANLSRLRRYAHDPDWLLDLLRSAEPRGEVFPLWMPAEDLRKLEHYPLVMSGLSARGALSDLDVVPRDEEPLDAYAEGEVVAEVLRRFMPEQDAIEPNVILRVPRAPNALGAHKEAPLPVVAADLLDHDDPRVRRAAEGALRRLALAS
ncbi:MAG: helix-turn-helix domain-containing protein [Gaiellaceae bacterium]